MTRYVVLWIPTLVEWKPEIINRNPEAKELKDVPSLPSCHLRINASDGSQDFDLFYKLGDDAIEKVIHFTFIDAVPSGFVIYRWHIDNANNDALLDSMTDEFHPSVYHYIKDLFHTHIVHDPECDSLLRGYCSDQEIIWGQRGTPKKIFTHYINEYVEKLEASYDTVAGQLDYLKTLINKQNELRTGTKKSLLLKKNCNRVAGESAYASSLLRLSRNTVKTKSYNRLLDILIRIEILIKQCDDAYNTLNNMYNNKLGVYGIWIGTAGIFLTLFLEVCHHLQGTPQPDVNEQTDSELQQLINRADSLARENESVLRQLRGEDQ